MKVKILLTAAALAPAAMPQAVAAGQHPATHQQADKHKKKHHHHKPPPKCTYPPAHSKLTLSVAKSYVKKGGYDTAFGQLRESHCVVSGGTIHLFGNGKQITQRSTKRDGSYSIRFQVKKTEKLQAIYEGKSKKSDPAASNTVTVHVHH